MSLLDVTHDHRITKRNILFRYLGAAVTMEVVRTETSIRDIKNKIGRSLYSMY